MSGQSQGTFTKPPPVPQRGSEVLAYLRTLRTWLHKSQAVPGVGIRTTQTAGGRVFNAVSELGGQRHPFQIVKTGDDTIRVEGGRIRQMGRNIGFFDDALISYKNIGTTNITVDTAAGDERLTEIYLVLDYKNSGRTVTAGDTTNHYVLLEDAWVRKGNPVYDDPEPSIFLLGQVPGTGSDGVVSDLIGTVLTFDGVITEISQTIKVVGDYVETISGLSYAKTVCPEPE